MNFQICTGTQEKAGVTKQGDTILFSTQAAKGARCELVLYPKDNGTVLKIPMKAEESRKTLYTVGLQRLDWENYDYNFEINGKVVIDQYAKRITGRENWGDEKRRPVLRLAEPFVPQSEQDDRDKEGSGQSIAAPKKRKIKEKEGVKIKSSFYFSEFNWRKDHFPQISKQDMMIYKLHVRGFSMGMRKSYGSRGTVGAVERRLDDLKELGVTTLLFMPLYEFEEFFVLDSGKEQKYPRNQINYWGYAQGSYFAPKASYLKENNPDELKRLIFKMHQKQMECILEFYFPQKMNPHSIIEILHYWHKEYHVDGFRILGNSDGTMLAAQDPRLGGCKLFFDRFPEELAQDAERFGPELFAYNDEFLYETRKILNHQSGNIYEFACQLRRQQTHQGFVNFIAENNGFPLWDVFSYEHKHNELNEEENRDGNHWNYSTNCGQEGFSRKKPILDFRRRQMRNALAVLFFAQGVPMLWMGDECGNTQNGNNNAYCQDNEVGWKDWRNNAASRQIINYVKEFAALRKKYPVLRSPTPYQMLDYGKIGFPDLSYHSDSGWKIDFQSNRSFVGMFYAGAYAKSKENLYIAYNFQYSVQKFALPRDMEWKLLLDTAREQPVLEKPEALGQIQEYKVKEQAVCLLSGTPIRGGRKN